MSQLQFRVITQGGFEDKIIQWSTRSQWTHVELIYPGKGYLGSNTPGGGYAGGVYLRNFNYLKAEHEAIGTVQCTDAQAATMWAWGESKIGTHYDYLAVLGDLFGTDWTGKTTYDCSAYVFAFFKAGGIMLLDLPYVAWINPGQIASSPLVNLVTQF